MLLAMLTITGDIHTRRRIAIAPDQLEANRFSLSIYGDPCAEIDDLLPSIRESGILVALVVAPGPTSGKWEVISGHRRLACALALKLAQVPCEVQSLPPGPPRNRAVLEYNRQRRKSFSQMMREADALDELWTAEAKERRFANLRYAQPKPVDAAYDADRRNSDDRDDFNELSIRVTESNPEPGMVRGRTDTAIGRRIGIGGKDVYRQARAIWRQAQSGDARAQSSIAQLDAGTKTIYCAYKDLRRRHRYSANFRPTPYDVWSFRHDRAFGVPHPGAIPAGVVAHALHYFTRPGDLVVDPMAGGGTTLDVAQSMGRRCLAYDLHPVRPEINSHDIRLGFPGETVGCDLIFCDPPYHTMLTRQYAADSVANAPLADWIGFLHKLTAHAFDTLRPGGRIALLLAPQTEKDLPRGFGYIDHVFFGYIAAVRAVSSPEHGLVAPWMVPTCLSRSGKRTLKGDCSDRCVTS